MTEIFKPPARPRRTGRPPLPGPRRRDRKVYLPDGAMELLRKYGRGSASEGILYVLAFAVRHRAPRPEEA